MIKLRLTNKTNEDLLLHDKRGFGSTTEWILKISFNNPSPTLEDWFINNKIDKSLSSLNKSDVMIFIKGEMDKGRIETYEL